MAERDPDFNQTSFLDVGDSVPSSLRVTDSDTGESVSLLDIANGMRKMGDYSKPTLFVFLRHSR